MEDKSIESLKQEFIQEIMSEQSFDTLKEWLYMHDEARYVASLTSKEPELIEYNKEFEKSLRQGQRNNWVWNRGQSQVTDNFYFFFFIFSFSVSKASAA
mgnify:FL=1